MHPVLKWISFPIPHVNKDGEREGYLEDDLNDPGVSPLK